MTDPESAGQGMPHYIGAGPLDRLEKLIAAVKERGWDRERLNPAEPPGLMGLPGPDGFYHDLLASDLEAVARMARAAERGSGSAEI